MTRLISWILAVSAALFISGIAFIVAGAREREGGTSAAAAAIETAPVASVRQIMIGTTLPTATAIYNAVGYVSSARGVEETEPRTDEEWATLGAHAASLAESGNLMLTGNRAVDSGDWVAMTRAMIAAAQKAMKAADAKSKEGILEAGSEINTTCDNCHAKYLRQ
jgi:hypothetical protein